MHFPLIRLVQAIAYTQGHWKNRVFAAAHDRVAFPKNSVFAAGRRIMNEFCQSNLVEFIMHAHVRRGPRPGGTQGVSTQRLPTLLVKIH